MKEMAVCGNCGAEFEKDSPKCPYCGAINETGAEKAYLKDLYEMKEELNELGDMPKQHYRRETVKAWKKVLLILAAVLVLVLLILGGLKWAEKHFSYNRKVSTKEQLLWEKENFPQFDIWYEEGNYEAIAEELWKEENAGYDLWEWEHYYFITAYDTHRYCMEERDYLTDPDTANKNTSKYFLGEVMYFLFFLRQADYTQEEWNLVQEWREDMELILYEDMKFTEKEVQELYGQINEDGFLNYDKCDKYAEKIWKRFIRE